MDIERQTWSGKFSLLSPWFSDIMDTVKRDCKNEHLSVDPYFVRQHFAGKPVARISLEEMRAVYMQQILQGQEKIAEFIANRWLFRHMDLYRFFEEELKRISPDFDKIGQLSEEQAKDLVQRALTQFNVELLFCFVVINDVVFPKEVLEDLQKQALEALSEREKNIVHDDAGIERYKQEMERMKERHEKKIQELTKRHNQEIQKLQIELTQVKKDLVKKTKELMSV